MPAPKDKSAFDVFWPLSEKEDARIVWNAALTHAEKAVRDIQLFHRHPDVVVVLDDCAEAIRRSRA